VGSLSYDPGPKLMLVPYSIFLQSRAGSYEDSIPSMDLATQSNDPTRNSSHVDLLQDLVAEVRTG
jgi:hypothetical protein